MKPLKPWDAFTDQLPQSLQLQNRDLHVHNSSGAPDYLKCLGYYHLRANGIHCGQLARLGHLVKLVSVDATIAAQGDFPC